MWRFAVALAVVGCGAIDRSAPASTLPAPIEAPTRFAEADAGGEAVNGQEAAQQQVLVVTGSIGVTVDAYAPARDALVKWIADHGGHVSDESTSHVDGQASYGSLTVRVPANQVEALVSWIQENDRVDSLQIHRQDVTEQYVDLNARVEAMKATQQRLLALAADRTASLADVLAAEQQLSRVQGDLESLVARQRVLQDQVSLATLSVSIGVRTPFSPLVEETVGHEVARTFTGSVEALGWVLREGLVAAVALIPWVGTAIAGLGALLLGLWATTRRLR